MGVYVGDATFVGAYAGNAAVSAVYQGDALLWRAGGGVPLPDYDTLAEYSLEELQAVSADLTANGSQSAYWQIFAGFLGQTKDFGARTGSYAGTGDNAKVIAQLVGICHDDLASDSTKKAGLTFLCNRSLAYAYQMNSSSTNADGWSSSKMRTTLNSGEVYQSLPSDLKDAAVAVLKQTNNTGHTFGPSAVTTTSDKFWLASGAELYGPTAGSGWSGANPIVLSIEGTQYEHFANQGVTFTSYALLADRNRTNTGGIIQSREGSLDWGFSWLRSPGAGNTSNFLRVDSSGQPGVYKAALGYGVCFGFSL